MVKLKKTKNKEAILKVSSGERKTLQKKNNKKTPNLSQEIM